MFFQPTQKLDQWARYAALCDAALFEPMFFDRMLAGIDDPMQQDQCRSARSQALQDLRDADGDQYAHLFQEVWDWAQDLHLRCVAGMTLCRLGKAGDDVWMFYLSMLSNTAMHPTLGKELVYEMALVIGHWRTQTGMRKLVNLRHAFPSASILEVCGRVLKQHKPASSVAQAWEDVVLAMAAEQAPAARPTADDAQAQDHPDLVLSIAIVWRDQEQLQSISADDAFGEERQQRALSALRQLGAPVQDSFAELDDQALRLALHELGRDVRPEVLQQVLTEVGSRTKIVWPWLRNFARDYWTDETRPVLQAPLAEAIVPNLETRDLLGLPTWLGENVFYQAPPAIALGWADVRTAWDMAFAAVGDDDLDHFYNSHDWSFRLAASEIAELHGLLSSLVRSHWQAAARAINGWDSFIERMGWVTEVKESDLIIAALAGGDAERARIFRDHGAPRSDDPAAKELWQHFSERPGLQAMLATVLAAGYRSLKEFEAAMRRFAPSVTIHEALGDPVAWVYQFEGQYSLYDSVDVVHWLAEEPAAWAAFYTAFQQRSQQDEPGLGNLNAWIKLAKCIYERLDRSGQQWQPLLRDLLRGWQQALAQAKGAIRESDYKQADREMARALAGDSSQVLCWLAA